MERIENDAGGIDPIPPELWQACAGSSITLPQKNSLVVYFPQGHMEQFNMTMGISEMEKLPFSPLTPQIICRVLNVSLRADKVTDDVYSRLTLIPEPEPSINANKVEEKLPASGKQTTPVFPKRLTPSDCGTHGGFSVPRNCALACFPPLDYTQVKPAQNLVARDLHGKEWKFHHIYRGTPPRHVLTTGWGTFITEKKLVPGDTVLFLCEQNGELRLGIRRASGQQNTVTSLSMLSNQNICFGVLVAASCAVATSCMFHVFYHPRTSPSEFIVPYAKYIKSLGHSLSIGMRIKLRFDSEDVPNRRYSGLISEMTDIDPVMWPGSKWRSVKVKLDLPQPNSNGGRVSAWDIHPDDSDSPSRSEPSPVSISKKQKQILEPSIDYMGYSRVIGVLQGQEILPEVEVGEIVSSPQFLRSTEDSLKQIDHESSGRNGKITGKGSCMVFGVSLSKSQ